MGQRAEICAIAKRILDFRPFDWSVFLQVQVSGHGFVSRELFVVLGSRPYTACSKL
jgi:hypothetical protein